MLDSMSDHPSPRSPTVLTNATTTTNHLVGDSIEVKSPDHCRILLQNPNGLSYDNECFEYLLCLQNLRDSASDILLLSETNLDWKNYQVYKQTSAHRRSVFQHSKQVHASSPVRFDTPYQPGGVATLLTGASVGRYHSSVSDELGRWTITNLSLRSSSILSIINCYQVCHQRPQTAGSKTAFMQQWCSLQKKYINPNPRKQFISDLDDILSQLQLQGNHILLCGDFK